MIVREGVHVGNPLQGDTTPAVKYHLGDHLGGNVVKDGAGSLEYGEEYTPYGETSFGSCASKRYRFTGKERDEEGSLYFHGTRYYTSWLGRWIACEAAGITDGTNLYAYTRRNPRILVDPSGTIGEPLQVHLIQQSGLRQPVTAIATNSGISQDLRRTYQNLGAQWGWKQTHVGHPDKLAKAQGGGDILAVQALRPVESGSTLRVMTGMTIQTMTGNSLTSSSYTPYTATLLPSRCDGGASAGPPPSGFARVRTVSFGEPAAVNASWAIGASITVGLRVTDGLVDRRDEHSRDSTPCAPESLEHSFLRVQRTFMPTSLGGIQRHRVRTSEKISAPAHTVVGFDSTSRGIKERISRRREHIVAVGGEICG